MGRARGQAQAVAAPARAHDQFDSVFGARRGSTGDHSDKALLADLFGNDPAAAERAREALAERMAAGELQLGLRALSKASPERPRKHQDIWVCVREGAARDAERRWTGVSSQFAAAQDMPWVDRGGRDGAYMPNLFGRFDQVAKLKLTGDVDGLDSAGLRSLFDESAADWLAGAMGRFCASNHEGSLEAVLPNAVLSEGSMSWPHVWRQALLADGPPNPARLVENTPQIRSRLRTLVGEAAGWPGM